MVITPECPIGPTLEKLSFSVSRLSLEIYIQFSFKEKLSLSTAPPTSLLWKWEKRATLRSGSPKEKLQLTKVKPTKHHYQAGSAAALKDYEEVLRNGMPEKILVTSAQRNLGDSSHNTSISHIGIFAHQLKFYTGREVSLFANGVCIVLKNCRSLAIVVVNMALW